MRIPLFITATDFANGEQVVLSSGSVADAVRASSALPFAFAPCQIEGRLLTDGFLSEQRPVSVALRHGVDVVVAVGFDSPYPSSVRSAGRFAFQLSAILANHLLKSHLAVHKLSHHGAMLPVMPRFDQRIRLFDIARIPYLIEQGELAAPEELPPLSELLAGCPAPAPVS